jgi:hypothetical protein
MPLTKRFEILPFLCIVDQHCYVFIVKKEFKKNHIEKTSYDEKVGLCILAKEFWLPAGVVF